MAVETVGGLVMWESDDLRDVGRASISLPLSVDELEKIGKGRCKYVRHVVRKPRF